MIRFQHNLGLQADPHLAAKIYSTGKAAINHFKFTFGIFVSGTDLRDGAGGIHVSNADYRLSKGFQQFGRSSHGFLTNEACMIGMETRTSAPVRIVRDNETLQHITISGLFPCGEGAGYAGGIVSAGVDGERCAEAVANYLGI